MASLASNSLTVAARRHGRRLAYWNGGLWAIGNGLASTMLVVYLAMELDAPGLGAGTGLILAAPNLTGVLRLATPALVRRLGDRRRFCACFFLASAVVLAALPLAAAPGRLPSPRDCLVALVTLWCIYHLLQYLATIALWSWLADLVPLRVRGRFIGRRERWMVLGQAGGMLAAALATWGRQFLHPGDPRWASYVLPTLVGVGFMLASLVPLALMPRAGAELLGHRCALAQAPRVNLSAIAAPFRDGPFVRLLAVGCWFSFFNGITQSAHYVYPDRVLGVGLAAMLVMTTLMRLGQFSIGPSVGRLADRLGNRPVLMASLLLVAQGPLFYLLATPGQPWWIAAAWLVWIAYAGLNVALPNLMLALAPRESNLPYIATYYAVTGLCYAASTIAGGALHDHFGRTAIILPGGSTWDYFTCLFLFGWITRMLGAVVLLAVVEPKPRV